MPNTTVVTKAEAIRRLRAAKFTIEADQLDVYPIKMVKWELEWMDSPIQIPYC